MLTLKGADEGKDLLSRVLLGLKSSCNKSIQLNLSLTGVKLAGSTWAGFPKLTSFNFILSNESLLDTPLYTYKETLVCNLLKIVYSIIVRHNQR
jgi:hypothetical protein